jgi:manganese transport protein
MEKHQNSLEEVHATVETAGKRSVWKRILAFFGPAYLVSVGYMDPGNWATDLEGGSRYGYQLIWVLVMSNLMAIILQSLSARLGIVYGRDLAQVNRETYPRAVNFCLYLLAEVAIAATDLAEVIGMAIGLHLLFDIPLLWGVTITIFDTFLLLYLQKLGIRKMEAFIIGLIAVIFACFAVELFFVKPSLGEVAKGIVPALPDEDALYIAIGIIGATVMPHNLYLHSALVQTRCIGPDPESKRKALRYNFIDSTVALNLALFVNAAILILAGAVFHKNGMTDINSIESAHELLAPLVGQELAPMLFAIALIAAGQSSTVTGTLAGQIVMEGYLHIRFNPWLRRLITRSVAVIPAFITILVAGEGSMTDLLILSQVILSIQLAFAIIPLIYAVSNREKMKEFTIKPWLQILAAAVTAVILYLNIRMVLEKAWAFLGEERAMGWKLLVVTGLILFFLLLLITLLYPLFRRKGARMEVDMHGVLDSLQARPITDYRCIALALDFSQTDREVLSFALKQAAPFTRLVLIHVVESAGAKVLGQHAADAESLRDEEHLNRYREQLRTMGWSEVQVKLGYRNRVSEIARLCREEQADLLVMGAHGHRGVFDFVYGQTIDSVRHLIDIPVLIVKGENRPG